MQCVYTLSGYEYSGERGEHQAGVVDETSFANLVRHVGSKCSHGFLLRSLSIMPAKLGINGFGRIGRLVFRAAMANPEVEVRGRIVRESGILSEAGITLLDTSSENSNSFTDSRHAGPQTSSLGFVLLR